VPENAENGDFGHTAPLTGPQIKGNFNKIGWQGKRIACQCQFFSSLLESQKWDEDEGFKITASEKP